MLYKLLRHLLRLISIRIIFRCTVRLCRRRCYFFLDVSLTYHCLLSIFRRLFSSWWDGASRIRQRITTFFLFHRLFMRAFVADILFIGQNDYPQSYKTCVQCEKEKWVLSRSLTPFDSIEDREDDTTWWKTSLSNGIVLGKWKILV